MTIRDGKNIRRYDITAYTLIDGCCAQLCVYINWQMQTECWLTRLNAAELTATSVGACSRVRASIGHSRVAD